MTIKTRTPRALTLFPTLGVALTALCAMWAIGAAARPLDPIGADEVSARLAQLQHTRWNGRGTGKIPASGDCSAVKITVEVADPQTQKKTPLTVELYQPDTGRDDATAKPAKTPVVIVIPSLQGVTVIEPKTATQLCEAGIAAIIADVLDISQPKKQPGIGNEDAQGRRGVLALRTLIDVASNTPAFDKNKIGMMGASLGAIMSSMMAEIEPTRLKAVVMTLAGDNLPYTLAHGNAKKVQALREARMNHLGIQNQDQYEEWLRPTIKYDPFYFVSRAKRERLMMITAKGDQTVPYVTQRELYEALGRPAIVEYSGAHVDTIISVTYFHFDDVINFFKARFGVKTDESAPDEDTPGIPMYRLRFNDGLAAKANRAGFRIR